MKPSTIEIKRIAQMSCMEVSLHMIFVVFVLVLVLAFVILFLNSGSGQFKNGILSPGKQGICAQHYGDGDWNTAKNYLATNCNCQDLDSIKSDSSLHDCCDYYCNS